MHWDVEVTDEFAAWFKVALDGEERVSVAAVVELLEEYGPALAHPHSSDVRSSRHGRMRELRIQHHGRPYRVFYCFDPRRIAILLIGGDKTGDDCFYERTVPIADRLYDEHLEELRREGGLMTDRPRRKFSQLVSETMTAEQRHRAKALATELRAAMPLNELRRARDMSQAALAELLEMDQGNLSKLEQRTDMYVSTLRRYVRALGGELEIVARFQEGDYRIEQFAEIADDAGTDAA